MVPNDRLWSKKNVHRKTWTMMTNFVHKIHIKTYGSNDRPWSKMYTEKLLVQENVHRKTWTLMTIFVHKIHIKTYGFNDRPWSKKCPQKNF